MYTHGSDRTTASSLRPPPWVRLLQMFTRAKSDALRALHTSIWFPTHGRVPIDFYSQPKRERERESPLFSLLMLCVRVLHPVSHSAAAVASLSAGKQSTASNGSHCWRLFNEHHSPLSNCRVLAAYKLKSNYSSSTTTTLYVHAVSRCLYTRTLGRNR